MNEATDVLTAWAAEHRDEGIFPSEVRQLHQQGRAIKARRALAKHARGEPSRRRRELQQAAVADPWLWLEAVERAPTLSTLNGIGFTLYGTYSPRFPLHIAIYWFTFVFLPVFPIRAYAVQPGPDKSFAFHAIADLPGFARWWRRGFAALLLLAGLGAGTLAWWESSHADLVVYNGFDQPVSVQVAGRGQVEVPAHAKHTVGGLVRGPVAVVSSLADGAEIERLEVDLGPRADAVVYNVGGRAVLIREWVVYGPGEPRDAVYLGVASVQHLDEADYLFEVLPDTKEVAEGSSIHNSLITALGDDWSRLDRASAVWSEEGPEAALAFARSRLLEEPTDDEALAVAMSALADDPDALVDQARAWRDAQPEDVGAHRYYQDMALDHHPEAVLAEYEALRTEHPGEAQWTYLAGRAQPEDEAKVALFVEALAQDADFAWAHLGVGFHRAEAGDLEEALAHYGRISALDPELAPYSDRVRLRLLAALGHPLPSPRSQAVVAEREPASSWRVFAASMASPDGDAAVDQGHEALEWIPEARRSAVAGLRLLRGDLEGCRSILAEIPADEAPEEHVRVSVLAGLSRAAPEGAMETTLPLAVEVLDGTLEGCLAAAWAVGAGHDLAAEATAACESDATYPTHALLTGALEPAHPAVAEALVGQHPDEQVRAWSVATVIASARDATCRKCKAEAERLLLPWESPAW